MTASQSGFYGAFLTFFNKQNCHSMLNTTKHMPIMATFFAPKRPPMPRSQRACHSDSNFHNRVRNVNALKL